MFSAKGRDGVGLSRGEEPTAAMLIAGTYEKAICGWELGDKQSVTPAFQVACLACTFKTLTGCGQVTLATMQLAAPITSRAYQGGGESRQVPGEWRER